MSSATIEKVTSAKKELAKRELARRRLLPFIQYTWQKSLDDPLIVGFHTRKICARIDRAIEDFKAGKSTFMRISVHPRAGKSDVANRYLVPFVLGKLNDIDILQVSYAASLATDMSKFSRDLIKSPEWRALHPNITLSSDTAANNNWKIAIDGRNSVGTVIASGLQGGITGKGGGVLILDDYCPGRAEAESKVERDNMWNAFTNDFITRRAPVSIVLVIATWWHQDDIHGRIENANNPNHDSYNPNFPVFEHLSFPARAADYKGEGDYTGKYLFLERFTEQFYDEQYAILGDYAAPAMLDCNPVPRHGGILKTDKIVWKNDIAEFPKDLRWMRVWDLAHTSKQRVSHDPDYTGGTLIAFRKKGRTLAGDAIHECYIADYVQFRSSAPERDEKIIQIAKEDGSGVKIIVENSLDAKDAGQYLKARLSGFRSVDMINCKGDKVQRCAPIESMFEAGNVTVINGKYRSEWLSGIQKFDGTGKSHDEMVDNITAAWQYYSAGAVYEPLKIKIG